MTMSQVDSAHCFSQSTDLVNFNQNRVGDFLFNTHSQTFRIRNKEVVPDELDFVAQSIGQHFPAFPVIFSHTVFNRENREFSTQFLVEFNHFFVGVRFADTFEFIFAVFIKFRRSGIHSENNIFPWFISCGFDSINNESQSFFGRFQIRSKTAFITDIGVMTGRFEVFLQGVENFRTHADSFTNRRRADRHNHKFLEVNRVVSVLTAVNNVHHRHRQNVSHCTAEITIKREFAFFSLSLSHSHRNGENGISTEVTFVFSAVEFNHGFINIDLVIGIQTGQSVINFIINIFHGFQNALTAETSFVAVAQFDCLMHTGRST